VQLPSESSKSPRSTHLLRGHGGLHPIGRIGEIGDIVDGILYLDQASFVTASTEQSAFPRERLAGTVASQAQAASASVGAPRAASTKL
jgi:hypothetical protein